MSIDISNVYPNQDLKVDLKTRQPPLFVGDGSTDFDGSADYLRNSATVPSITGAGAQASICAWVNFDSASTLRNIASFCNTANDDGIVIYQNSAEIGVAVFNNAPTVREKALTSVSTGRWFFVVGTWDKDTASQKVYVDGVRGSGNMSSGIGIEAGTDIGARSSATPQYYFDGQIAGVKYFDVELTQAQIRELYKNPGLIVPTGVSSSNLKRYYKLETNFNDSGADSENLTAFGSPSLTVTRPQLPRGLDFSPGRSGFARSHTGRAVDFDGSADKITAAHYNPSGDYLTTTGWVNADTLRAQGLIHNGDTGRNSFLFYMGSASGNLLFYWNDTTGDGAITHQTNLVAGRWYHLAAVMDMSDSADHQVTFYIDGIAATGTRTSSSWFGDNTYQFGNQYATAGWFDGKIADCRIYDVALTQTQIRELYKNPEQVLPTGVNASNLRRYYPLSDYNDTSGTGGRYFQDMGADGEPAEDLGSALMAFGQSVPCPQLGLQQSATRVYFENNTTRADATIGSAPGTTCTMSAWIMVDNTGNYQYIFSNGTSLAATAWFGIAKNNSNNKLYTLQGSAIAAESSLQLSGYGEWNHVVVMTKSTAPYVRFFINGVEDTSINDISMVAYNLTSTSVSFGGNPVYANHMQGFANDCAIWDVELSDSEVASLYNSGSQGMDVSTVQSANLLGWWKCDDLTSFKDYSGNGANAVLNGSVKAASFPENASGSTIVGDFSMKRKGDSVFNFTGGGDSRLELAANPDILPAVSGGYTFSAFVRLQTTGSDQAIMMSSATGVDEWGTYYNSSNNKYYVVMSNGSSNISDRAFTNTVTDNEWHHVAWTLDLSQEPAVGETYLDGVSDTSFTRTGMNTPPAASSFGIGYDPGNSNKEAFAAISSLKIYQRVLSADEIKSVYLSDERMIRGNKNE